MFRKPNSNAGGHVRPDCLASRKNDRAVDIIFKIMFEMRRDLRFNRAGMTAAVVLQIFLLSFTSKRACFARGYADVLAGKEND